MSAEPRPETHARKPEAHTRLLTITLGQSARPQLTDRLDAFANRFGFAIWFRRGVMVAGETFVKMYRGDMRMIGVATPDARRFEFRVIKTPGHPAPLWAVDEAVRGLRREITALPETTFSQKVLVKGDLTPNNRDVESSMRNAMVTVPKGVRSQLVQQLKSYAESYGFAIRIARSTPEPDNISFELFRDDIILDGSMPFDLRNLYVYSYPTYGRTVASEVVEQAFLELKRAVEQVPGVKFLERR